MIFSSKNSNTATHRKLSFLISRTTSITKPQVASNWCIPLRKEDDKHYSPEHNVCPIPPSFGAITANLWTTTNWQPIRSRVCEQQLTWESSRNWFWGETTLPVTCNPVSTVTFFSRRQFGSAWWYEIFRKSHQNLHTSSSWIYPYTCMFRLKGTKAFL